MNKFLTTTIVSLFISSSFASYVTPEVARDKKTLSADSIGLVWSKNNAVAVKYIMSDSESKSSVIKNETESSFLNPYGMFHFDNFSTQVSINKYKQDNKDLLDSTNNDEIDGTIIQLAGAYRLTESFGAVVAYSGTTLDLYDSTTEYTISNIDLGINYKASDFIYLGFGITKSRLELSSPSRTMEADTTILKAGIGYQDYKDNEGVTLEAFLTKQGKKKAGSGSTTTGFNDITSLTLQGTMARDNFEIDGGISITTSDDYEGDDTEDEYTLDLDFEFLLTPNFYITPGFQLTSGKTTSVYGDSESDSKAPRLKVGYRMSTMDVSFAVESATSEYTSSGNTSENEALALELNFSYFF